MRIILIESHPNRIVDRICDLKIPGRLNAEGITAIGRSSTRSYTHIFGLRKAIPVTRDVGKLDVRSLRPTFVFVDIIDIERAIKLVRNLKFPDG